MSSLKTPGGHTDGRRRSLVHGARRSALWVVLAALALMAPAAVAAIIGTDNAETINGGPGADTIFARAGNDVINGQGGNDDIDGGAGADDIRGGTGEDAALYGGRTAPVTVTLDNKPNDGEAGEGDNVHSDVEDVYGGAGNDTLTGSAAANLLDGGAGNDRLVGGRGVDQLYGGPGNDVIDSRDGAVDIVDCGAGTDTATTDPADVVVGCEKNGLLARIRSLVTTQFAVNTRTGLTTVLTLVVQRIPGGARVTVRCRGRGCPFSSKRFTPHGGRVNVAPGFGGHRLRPGSTIDVAVTAANRIGKVERFRTFRTRSPSTTILCVRPGTTTPRKRC